MCGYDNNNDMDTDNKHIDPVGLVPKVLSGEATPEEQKIVDEWLSADPDNRVEFDSFARLWDITSSATAAGDIDVEAEWQRLDRAITHRQTRTIHLKRVLQIAAAVILVSALTFTGVKITGPILKRAPANEYASIYLPDGTVVSLNAGSRITYKKGFGISHRQLSLKGEAYFEVKKSNLPFVVSAGEACISVTGTEFNVKAYADKPLIRVTVTKGTVRLYETSHPDLEAVLTAGETGTYNKSNRKIDMQAAVNLNDFAWKTGILDFNNTPLSEVGDILANTYHISVNIDPALHDCSITVRFENQELDSVVSVLKSTLDLTVSRTGKKYTISGKGC
jgi:transmembrane sensor